MPGLLTGAPVRRPRCPHSDRAHHQGVLVIITDLVLLIVAAVELEGNCHARYTRRLRLEARPLRRPGSIGEPEGTQVGVAGQVTGSASAVARSALPTRKPLRSPGLTCQLTSSQAARSPAKGKDARCRNHAVTPLPNYRERCSVRAGKHRRRFSGRSMTRYGSTGRAIKLTGSPT